MRPAVLTTEATPEEKAPPVLLPAGFTPETSAYLWMLFGAFSFAVMGALAHKAGEGVDWRLVATTRAILALAIASMLARRAGARLVVVGSRTVWMRSLAGSISLLCTFYALVHLPIAECLTLTNMFPLWVAILSWPMLGHMPSPASLVAAVIAVAGVAVMGINRFEGMQLAAAPAYAVAILASFTSAVAMIGLHRLRDMAATAIVAHFSGVSILFCLASLFLPGMPAVTHADWSPLVVVSLLGVGITATMGQLSITKAFGSAHPSRVAVVALTQVIFALFFDWLIWDRPFDVWQLVGMTLVLAPTAWVIRHRPNVA